MNQNDRLDLEEVDRKAIGIDSKLLKIIGIMMIIVLFLQIINSNLSVRRRGHVADPPKQAQPVAPKQGHTSNVASAPPPPKGPPPPYSASATNVGKSNMNAAPPAYSSYAAPPGYPSATGLNSHANYPRQGYSGVNSGMPQPGQGHASSPYNNNYGGNRNYGWSQPNAGSYGGAGYPSAGYSGGYHSGHYGGHNGMPNYGGGMMGPGMMSGGMMGPGMMGGGMMGGGMMGGGVQPLYVQQKSSSPLMGIAGGALTGLAVYQLARGFGGGSSHQSTQHIYHHYDNPPEYNQKPSSVQNQQITQTAETSHTPDQTQSIPQTPFVPAVPVVPLAPFPPGITATESNCTENCTTETNVAAITPVPEIDHEFPFTTIHPSLFPYGSFSQNKELEYWAKSVDRELKTPDTNNSDSDSESSTTSP